MRARCLPPRRLLTHLVVVSVLAAAVLLTGQGQAQGAVAAVAAETGPSSRALWVWDTSTPAETVALAQAQGIDQLYAAVPPQVGSSPQLADLQELVALAEAAGLRVDALGGDPGWVDNPTWVVTNWLQPALATGLFTGIHVDIEPYTTAAWRKKRATVVAKYLATLDALRQAAGSTPLEADIPFWLHEVPAGSSTLDREVMARTDGVTVMAYRNTAAGPDGTITLATPAVTAGTALGKPVRIGQETTFLGTDPVAVKQTFFGQTRTAMEVQLAQVGAAFGGQPGFAGLAVHDAAGYAAMAP
jgi:hypothetical protein